MIKFISEDMPEGEFAALVHDGPKTIIMVNKNMHDLEMCLAAVNRLLAAAGTFTLHQT